MHSLVRRAFHQYRTHGTVALVRGVAGFVRNVTSDLVASEYPATVVIDAYRHGFEPRTWCYLDLDNRDPAEYIAKVTAFAPLNRGYKDLLDNKYAFHIATDPYSDALPAFYGTIERGEFHPASDEDDDLQDLITRHDDLVLKPFDANHGDGFYHLSHGRSGVDIHSREPAPDSVATLVSELDGYIVSEYVRQHPYAEQIYSAAANTIRVLTFINPETGDVEVRRATHRFGSPSSAPTDNFSAGGYCAAVNIDTGELGEIVTTDAACVRQRHATHPDTEEHVAGVTVPQWGEVCTLCRKLAKIHRPASIVGWDVIVTADGPVVVEGNSSPGIHLMQVEEGLLTDPVARQILG